MTLSAMSSDASAAAPKPEPERARESQSQSQREPEPEPEPSLAARPTTPRSQPAVDQLRKMTPNPAGASSSNSSLMQDVQQPAALPNISTEDPQIEETGGQDPPPRMEIFAAQCAVGGVLGFVGFALTLLAAKDEACGIVDHPEHGYDHLTLTRWPSTISELNSDWQSARGRLFFGFMLATAALLYASRMPDELDRQSLRLLSS
eukprot:COSAG02_NODE_15978_length_1123_cov_1.556641_2_plen_204_part_00